MKQSTIAAISTPLGPGGIGVIRISGPKALEILNCVFRPGEKEISAFQTQNANVNYQSRRVYYGKILDPNSGKLLDEALAIFMKAPKSFTREDVVELQTHSGFVVLDRILNAVLDSGAILAEAGEFTKRAFLNGRIDLSQAEAVIDMINAPCETAVHMASQQMMGRLKERVETIRSRILAIRAQLEADIEFSEETFSSNNRQVLLETIRKDILSQIEKLIQNQKDAAIYRDGVLLSIAGLPNVGKSSLLNQLVEKETAIVSEVPGTTRDVVKEYLTIRGVPIVLCDTAGLHDSSDPVECIGIKKAKDQIQQSDTILFVLDASRQLMAEEKQLIEALKTKRSFFLINKIDIAEDSRVGEIKEQIKQERVLEISAKTGVGIPALKDRLFHGLVETGLSEQKEIGLSNLRQRKLLERSAEQLKRCCNDLLKGYPTEMVSECMKDAGATLEEIVGKRDSDDLYETIFSQFCIGK